MKLADIQVGEDYAWHRGGDSYVRATVLEKGSNMERRVYDGTRADFGGHISRGAGVRIRYASGGLAGSQQKVVPPGSIHHTWTEQEEQNRRKEERRLAERQEQERVKAAAGNLNSALGVRAYGTASVGAGYVVVWLLPQDADRLADLLMEAT